MEKKEQVNVAVSIDIDDVLEKVYAASAWHASPKSEMPYTMPKLTAFADERICGVTSESATPSTCAAVLAATWRPPATILKPTVET